jgi:hypothetical protein
MWAVRHLTEATANALLEKFEPLLFSPVGFLAGLADVQEVTFQPNDFAYSQDSRRDLFVVIATRTARANGAVLLTQMRELLEKYPKLDEYMQDPLKGLIEKGMDELRRFVKGEQIDVRPDCGGTISAAAKAAGCPKPVNAFPNLCRLAYLALARPTNNNRIESRWSLLTGKYLAGMRASKPEWLGAIFRKMDIKNLGLEGCFGDEDFMTCFRDARKFMHENREEIRALYRIRHEESEIRRCRRDKAPDQYKSSGIVDPHSSKAPTKEEGTESRAKHHGARTSRKSETSRIRAEGRRSKARHEGSDSETSEDEVEDGLSSSGMYESSDAESFDDSECGSDPAGAFDETESFESDREGIQGQERDNQETTMMRMDNDSHVAESDRDAPAHTDSRPMLEETNAQTNQSCHQSSPESAGSSSRPPQTSKKEGEAAIESSFKLRGFGMLERGESSAKSDVNDDSSSDESDVGSDFAGGDDDEEICPWTTHPFSDDDEHTEGSGTEKERYKWKLSYTRSLLQKSPWKATENSAGEYRSRRKSKKGPAADSHMVINRQVILTRMDGQSFPLMKESGCLFYVLFEMTGLELIYVTEIFKTAANKLMVKYCRVLSTKRAAEECEHEHDIQQKLTIQNCSINTNRLGRASLRELSGLQAQGGKRRTFHRGDVTYETEACNIVGFIGWSPAGNVACDASMLKNIKCHIPTVQSLKEVDWVYCGDDFSDVNPDLNTTDPKKGSKSGRP